MRSDEFTPAPIWYFSYGMLTDPRKMKGAELIGAAELKNFNFELLLFANVIPMAGKTVTGVLWNVTRDFLGDLDQIEGCPWLYNRKTVPVYCNGTRYEAEVYTMTPDQRDDLYGTLPSKTYIRSLIVGYQHSGISLTQISNALENVPKISDERRKEIAQNPMYRDYDDDDDDDNKEVDKDNLPFETNLNVINEVNMSPSALKNFTNSPIVQNMLVGFEAEMLIPQLKDYTDMYSDANDMSKDIPFPLDVDWRDKIKTWVENGNRKYNHYNKKDAPDKIIKSIERNVSYYINDSLTKYLRTAPGKEDLYLKIKKLLRTTSKSKIEHAIRYGENAYYKAKDKISAERFPKYKLFKECMRYNKIKTLADALDKFGFTWPYEKKYTGKIPMSKIVSSFKASTGFTDVRSSTEPHDVARKPGRWVFETDGSLFDRYHEAAGIELVSPTMTVNDALSALDKLYNWVTSINAKTNETCGFHMGVSIKDIPVDNIDYLKLAIFLGDKYVLKLFDRLDNEYTRSALDYMVKGGIDSQRSKKYLKTLKDGLTSGKYKRMQFIMNRYLGQKYMTIHPHNNYIEFRSAGGLWIENKSNIENTLLRYVRVMAIAADPMAEQEEYYKKLYKLLTSRIKTVNKDSIVLFAKYISGQINLDKLKTSVKSIQNRRPTQNDVATDTTANTDANTNVDTDIDTNTITEVNMGRKSLNKFIKSPTSKDIVIGFEAEMIVPGLEDMVRIDGEDYIEDYSHNIPIPSGDNMEKEILEWFAGGDNPEDPDDISRCILRLLANFDRYVARKANDYVSTKSGEQALYKLIKEYRIDNSMLATNDAILSDIDEKNYIYRSAYDTIFDDFTKSTNFLPEYLDDLHMNTMNDFCSYYSLSWPYYKQEYQPSLTIEDLEDDFVRYTGFSATVSHEYHGIRPAGVWVFEPDSSIVSTHNGRGIELISPPLPIDSLFDSLDKFWNWAYQLDITANKSCGFHVSVSISDKFVSEIDKLKLVLFLGDKYVAKIFDRGSNSYASSNIDHLKSQLTRFNVGDMINTVKSGIDNVVNSKFMQSIPIGYDRYFSIDVRENYIEFRSAGGNYFEMKDELENTIMRYAKVLTIAADPNAEKNEYLKKLYKLLEPVLKTSDSDIISAFAKYAAGIYSADELKAKISHIRFLRPDRK